MIKCVTCDKPLIDCKCEEPAAIEICPICDRPEFKCDCAKELGKPILQPPVTPLDLMDHVRNKLREVVNYAEDAPLTGVPHLDVAVLKVQIAMYRVMNSYLAEMGVLVRELAEMGTNVKGEDCNVQS